MEFRALQRILRRSVLTGALLLLAGCNVIPPPQADLTRYYVLTSPRPAQETPPPPSNGGLRLGLRFVELPEYLKNRAILVRDGTNELVFNDYARWAEPLEAGLARVLRAQLIASPAVSRVYGHPFPFEEPRDYDLSVRVIRCEGQRNQGNGSVAAFMAVMEITSPADGNVITRQRFTAPEAAWDGSDYAELARLLSDSVAVFSREVVAALPEKK